MITSEIIKSKNLYSRKHFTKKSRQLRQRIKESGPSVHNSIIQNSQMWKQPKCPSTDEWIKKMLYTHTLLLLLLLSHFSHVRLCATPETEAYQAPPSLGFSRQEHWSRLPFPSPMHESEK